MRYDRVHNITSKDQSYTVTSSSGSTTTNGHGTYLHSYAYTPSRPHAPVAVGSRSYSYDANGNQRSFTEAGGFPNRALSWDEENRLMSVLDRTTSKSSLQTDFVYDAAGERVLKIDPRRGSDIAYINQHYQVQDRATPTKHVFVGTSRIASKVVPAQAPEGENLYFYHPDHLGTTGFITDYRGHLHRHTTYYPFGETWVDEGQNAGPSDYLFTGKELDEETGLYYYGARYYDPRTSVWQSTDPLFMEQGDRGLSTYHYSFLNPIRFKDPDGNCVATERGLDCLAHPRQLNAQADGAIVDAWNRDAYGEVAVGLTLKMANTGNYIFGFAGQAIVAPGNATYNMATGFSDGDYGQALQGSVDLLFVFGMVKAGTPSEPVSGKNSASAAKTRVPRSGQKGVDPNHHNANVMVQAEDGAVVSHQRFVSGKMTPKEKAMGFPKGMLASHTEARAVTQVPLKQGQTMTITGQKPPCPSCKGYMNRAAKETGAKVRYQWREDGKTLTWEAKQAKPK